MSGHTDNTVGGTILGISTGFAEGICTIGPYNTSASKPLITNSIYYYNPNEIDIVKSRANSIKNYQRKLSEMRKLPDNWNGYGSKKPNGMAIRISQDVLDILHQINLPPNRIAPSAEDGVSITFAKGENRAMIECYNDGDIIAVIYKGDSDPKVWSVENNSSSIEKTLYDIDIFLN